MALRDIQEYICTICREILLEPVTLPCNHTSCAYCLEKTLDNNRYQCFLCRKFIGGWYRQAKRRNLLVNQTLWSEIQERFPDLIQKKSQGESIDVDIVNPPIRRTLQFSVPGEIKHEFELSLEKLKAELRIDKEKEDKLSEEFIRQLEEEENRIRMEQEKLDEQLARDLTSELNSDLDTQRKAVEMQLLMDEKFAKRLVESESPVPAVNTRNAPKSVFDKSDKFKRRPTTTKTAIFGPMDRFLENRRKNGR